MVFWLFVGNLRWVMMMGLGCVGGYIFIAQAPTMYLVPAYEC